MSKPITVSAQVEILAPPPVVRSVFLDFARYKQWQAGWEITPIDSSKQGPDLSTGDRLKVSMHGMKFRPTVTENSPECFTWEGSLYGLIIGRHQFSFFPSLENPGGTTFFQSEDFHGPLTIFFRSWSKKERPMENWDKFNTALKKEVEKSQSQA